MPGLGTCLAAIGFDSSAAAWSELLERLLTVTTDASAIDLNNDPLQNQILNGELPWTLACLLPDIAECENLAESARREISTGVGHLLDGEGVPHGRYLTLSHNLLATWTRTGLLAKAAKRKLFTRDAELQFEWFVRQMLRFTRRNGSLVTSRDPMRTLSPDMLDAALKLAGDSDDKNLASIIFPAKKSGGKKRRRNTSFVDAPAPSVYSDWAETALMRPEWRRPDEYFALTFSDGKIDCELSAQRGLICSGTWQTEIQADGKPLDTTAEWHELCWYSDDDVDYLELEQELGRGWKVQRHILFAREDRFIFFGDAILGNRPESIEYQSVLPLVDGVLFSPQDETREGVIKSDRPLGLALPLALPEWRSERGVGSLAQIDDGLQLTHQVNASAAYSAMFIDLWPSRMKKELTWRQLTIAEKLEILGRDKAAGFRVQIGKEQWLIYRSLVPPANRSILGQNLSQEFVCAQFDTEGETIPLIEIDAEDD